MTDRAKGSGIVERIAAGLAPASATDLDAALAIEGEGTARALTWALAHRATFGANAAWRVEETVTRHLTSAYHGALVELVGALHVYWPEGLLAPRVRGALHVALELDALGAQELFLVLQPLLAAEERLDVYVRHAGMRPLGARVRVASLARGVGLAASWVGLGAILPGERADDFLRTVEQLYRDRDPAVGVRAAWAVGALARSSERAAALARPSSEPGVAARRAMVARTARWILGDLDEDELLAELRDGIGKRDVFVRATAVQAMQLGARIAPATTSAVVESLVAGAAPEVLSAAAAFAAAIEEPDRRAALLDRVRAEVGRRATSDATLRLWVGPRSDAVEAIHAAFVALRAAARESPRAAHDASAIALDRARRATDALDDDVDRALDLLVLDSPLLRDAATASAATDAERVRRYRAWVDVVERMRAWRVARAAERAPAAAQRDRLRRLARVLDASPSLDATGAKTPAAPFHDACRVVLASLFAGAVPRAKERGTKEKGATRDASLDRPRALALAAAIQPLVVHEALLATEVVAASLSLDATAVVRHLADASAPPLAAALRAVVALRDAIDEGASLDALEAAAGALRDALVVLGASDPLTHAARAIADAASAMRTSGAVEAWRDAIVLVDRAVRAACERVGVAARAPLAVDKLERAIRSLLAHAGVAPILHGTVALGVDRAARDVAKALPPMLARLVEVAATAAKARARPSSAPTRRGPNVMGPGWRIGDYVVERLLGSGGMGRCVLVRRRLEESQKNARRWVLKLPQSAELTSAFRNEALALLFLSKAKHPAIVRFVSYVDYGYRLPFLVMEYVAGEALDRRLLRGALAPTELYEIGALLADGVAKSHEMQIAHHDIKPANVVLRDEAPTRPVLVDWGLAGAAYPWAGTPEYMAPERYEFARARRTATGGAPNPPAADVFALGCVLAEMCSGRALLAEPLVPADVGAEVGLVETYRGLDPSMRREFACEILATRPACVARRLERALKGADPRFASLVERALTRRREERPTAKDVAKGLRALAKGA